MKKLIFSLSSIGLTYTLPLLDVLELLLEIPILTVISGIVILLSSQPRFSIRQAKDQHESDQYSIYKIQFAAFLGQFLSVLEWRFRVLPANESTVPFLFWVGLFFLIVGLAIRIWSIRVLGKYFSSVVLVKPDHQLVQSGLYAWIRHPSYLGACMALGGCMLTLQASYSFVLGSIALIWAYYHRILAEELTLQQKLGLIYLQYQSSTYRLFPFIW
ncbi:MAG: isoprenylcysteine carboxylmethyltransferase family protein [Bacteroidota bacterium]